MCKDVPPTESKPSTTASASVSPGVKSIFAEQIRPEVPPASASISTALYPSHNVMFQTFRSVGDQKRLMADAARRAGSWSASILQKELPETFTLDSASMATAMYPQRTIYPKSGMYRMSNQASDRPIVTRVSGNLKSKELAVESLKKGFGVSSLSNDQFAAYRGELEARGLQFELPVDHTLKATVFNPFKFNRGGKGWIPYAFNFGKKRRTNPQMRSFWFATLTFFLAFTGWFCLMPLQSVIRADPNVGICDNQDDVNANGAECICKASCKNILGYAKIGNVGSTIFVRVVVGSMLEIFGPVNVQSVLMGIGVLLCSSAAFIQSGATLILVQTLLGALGATFVTNQFWMPLNFATSVVGTANATAGGWGNVGGGFANGVMPLIYRLVESAGHPAWLSWRLAMLFPVVAMALTIPAMKACSQDTPLGKIDVQRDLQKKEVSIWDYAVVLKDYRVLLLAMHYSACFGTELCVTQEIVSHFTDNFGLSLELAGALGFGFGAMNLFARSLGGIMSDGLGRIYGMRGRIWAHFLMLLGEGVMLYAFGHMRKELGWVAALLVLIGFSAFVQAAEGTTYAMVPFMMPSYLGIVSAVVGAGGNLGAVIGAWSFYKPDYGDDYLLPFKLHSAYVLFWTLTTPLIHFKYSGSMFFPPALSRFCDHGVFAFALEWQLTNPSYEGGSHAHQQNWQVRGTYTAPWRLRELLKENKPASAFTSLSQKFKMAADEGAVGRAASLKKPVFIPNVQYLDKEVFLRHDIAVKDGVKSVLLIPIHDTSGCAGLTERVVLECGSYNEMRLLPGFTAEDVVDRLLSSEPASASQCFEQITPVDPALVDHSFSRMPFAQCISPYFTYAIQWMKVGDQLQVIANYDQGRKGSAAKSTAVNRFSTESYSVRLYEKTFVYQNCIANAAKVPVFVESVQDLSEIEYPRTRLAKKHGVQSCLFIPVEPDRVIEIGSLHRLKLLDGVGAGDILAAIKEGTLAQRKLFKADAASPLFCEQLPREPARAVPAVLVEQEAEMKESRAVVQGGAGHPTDRSHWTANHWTASHSLGKDQPDAINLTNSESSMLHCIDTHGEKRTQDCVWL
jgi:NNP family nitrate/nitrite transporter-like MFS transporter